MITYTFKHITPVMSGGRLASIGFMLVASSDGYEETASWNGLWNLPAPPSGAYTQDELTTRCNQIADAMDMRRPLESRIKARRDRDAATASASATPPPQQTDAQRRVAMFDQVDNTIAALQSKYTRFEQGYMLREEAAHAYIDSGYTIEPSDLITRFADNVGMEYPAAAALILSQAATMRPGLIALENLRMDKYLIVRALTIEAAQDEFLRIINEANTIAAGLK
jgi:hypothetical protein